MKILPWSDHPLAPAIAPLKNVLSAQEKFAFQLSDKTGTSIDWQTFWQKYIGSQTSERPVLGIAAETTLVFPDNALNDPTFELNKKTQDTGLLIEQWLSMSLACEWMVPFYPGKCVREYLFNQPISDGFFEALKEDEPVFTAQQEALAESVQSTLLENSLNIPVCFFIAELPDTIDTEYTKKNLSHLRQKGHRLIVPADNRLNLDIPTWKLNLLDIETFRDIKDLISGFSGLPEGMDALSYWRDTLKGPKSISARAYHNLKAAQHIQGN